MEVSEKLIFSDPDLLTFIQTAKTARDTGFRMFVYEGRVFSTQVVILMVNIHDGEFGEYEEVVKQRSMLFKS